MDSVSRRYGETSPMEAEGSKGSGATCIIFRHHGSGSLLVKDEVKESKAPEVESW